jgi:hypothetical protein
MLYNPIIRNFNRIRRILLEEAPLQRRAVRPAATFAELVPREHRSRIWARLRQEGMMVGEYDIPLRPVAIFFACVIAALTLWLVIDPGICMAMGLLFAVAVGGLAVWCALSARTHSYAITLGEAALAMTTGDECRAAGYRFTQNEIFLKVRRIVAEVGGLDPAEIKPEKSFRDLGFFE